MKLPAIVKKPKNLIQISVIIVCCAGLLEQVQYVSTRYFQYRTRTIITIGVRTTSEFKSISLCFRHNDILNTSAILSEYGIHIVKPIESGYESQTFYEMTKKFTISDYFKFSPPPNEILKPKVGCFFRYPSTFSVEKMNREQCHELFSIKKYLIKQDICYLFTPLIDTIDLKLHEYTLSSGYTGLMYILRIDPLVLNSIFEFSVAIHSNKSDFLVDSTFASDIDTYHLNAPTTHVFHKMLLRLRLPPPYDTMCRTPGAGSNSRYEEAFQEVNSRVMRDFDYSTPLFPSFNSSSQIRKVLNHRAFKSGDMSAQKLAEVVKVYLRDISSCYSLNHITRTQFDNDNGSSFKVHWTKDENVVTQYAAEQELLDYVVYICSSVGIWFGLSAYSSFEFFGKLFLKSTPMLEAQIAALQDQSVNQKKTFEMKYRFVCRKLILIQKFNEQLYDIISNK